jgi:hypothetical protein
VSRSVDSLQRTEGEGAEPGSFQAGWGKVTRATCLLDSFPLLTKDYAFATADNPKGIESFRLGLVAAATYPRS